MCRSNLYPVPGMGYQEDAYYLTEENSVELREERPKFPEEVVHVIEERKEDENSPETRSVTI